MDEYARRAVAFVGTKQRGYGATCPDDSIPGGVLGRTRGARAPNGDRPMSLDILRSRADVIEIFQPESEAEPNVPWAERVVTATVTAFTVLFVSSVAVLMYLA